MCDGNYEKDPAFAASYRKIRYDRFKATCYLRGRYRRIDGKRCVYCGFYADTGDHVPALFAGYTNGVVKGVIVSSCFTCNSLLGPFSSTCLKERATFLESAYEVEIERNEILARNSKSLPKWSAKAEDCREKAKVCKELKNALNCNMIEGSAKKFKENLSLTNHSSD